MLFCGGLAAMEDEIDTVELWDFGRNEEQKSAMTKNQLHRC